MTIEQSAWAKQIQMTSAMVAWRCPDTQNEAAQNEKIGKKRPNKAMLCISKLFQKTITRYYKTKSRQFRSTKHAGLNASLQYAAASIIDISSPGLQIQPGESLQIEIHHIIPSTSFNIFQNPALHVGITCLACSGSVWFQLRCMRWWFGMVGLGSTYYMGNCRICRRLIVCISRHTAFE